MRSFGMKFCTLLQNIYKSEFTVLTALSNLLLLLRMVFTVGAKKTWKVTVAACSCGSYPTSIYYLEMRSASGPNYLLQDGEH